MARAQRSRQERRSATDAIEGCLDDRGDGTVGRSDECNLVYTRDHVFELEAATTRETRPQAALRKQAYPGMARGFRGPARLHRLRLQRCSPPRGPNGSRQGIGHCEKRLESGSKPFSATSQGRPRLPG